MAPKKPPAKASTAAASQPASSPPVPSSSPPPLAASSSPSAPSSAASGSSSLHPASSSSTSSPSVPLPLWLTEGASQRDKNALCESVYVYTPDGKTELIKNARVQFVDGRRYGLIGRNGIGKSTLLQHVYAGTLPGFPRYLRVLYVQQHDMVHVDDEVVSYVVNSDAEKRYLEAEEERLLTQLEEDEKADTDEIQQRLDSVTDRLAVMDARRAGTRASAILTGLGFTPAMQRAAISSLSGGWKQRVALACALFVHSDLLLLDEPTNHLDFPAVRWLEAFLKQSLSSTLVLVSHDRAFLNAVSTDIVELVEQRLDYYRGDYTAYVKTHEEQLRARRHDYEVQQKKIAELRQFIEEAKKSDNPATMNLQRSRAKQLEKMELVPEPPQSRDFRFTFPDPGALDHSLVEINDLSFRYQTPDQQPGHWLLQHVSLHMEQTARIGILGVNGVGKSTLIKLIRGELSPQSGVCRLNPHCRCVLFTQHHIDQLDLSLSSLDYLQHLFPSAKEHQIRCLAPSTEVLRADGTAAPVSALKVGDLLCGDSHLTVAVVNRGARAEAGQMYKVTQSCGLSFYCNAQHVLVLVACGVGIRSSENPNNVNAPHARTVQWYTRCRSGACGCNGLHRKGVVVKDDAAERLLKARLDSRQEDPHYVADGDVLELTVAQWLRGLKSSRSRLKCFKAPLPIAPVAGSAVLPVPPYLLGLWLAHGEAERATFAVAAGDEDSIGAYLVWYAHSVSRMLCTVIAKESTSRDDGTLLYRLSAGVSRRNPVYEGLKALRVIGNKHIPALYLTAPRADRLSLLAGLLDSDGDLRTGDRDLSFRFTQEQPHRRLFEDTVSLAQSLGLTVSVGSSTNRAARCARKTPRDGASQRLMREVEVSGSGILDIPLLVPRKQPSRDRCHNTSASSIDVQAVSAHECGEFLSLQVSGNQRFLLKDGTVLHNSVMGRFGLDAHLIQQKIGQLSGGQRSRVAFAILTWKEPHLIVMDEPTNHLDLETIEALIAALTSFNGGVLLVSHDQYFLSSVAKEFWAFSTEGEVRVFYDLEDAKAFSYAALELAATSKGELLKQTQLQQIAQKQLQQQTQPSQQAADAASRERGGKKKRKTKRGGGGIDMAELKVAERLQQLKEEEDNREARIVDIVVRGPDDAGSDEQAAGEEADEAEEGDDAEAERAGQLIAELTLEDGTEQRLAAGEVDDEVEERKEKKRGKRKEKKQALQSADEEEEEVPAAKNEKKKKQKAREQPEAEADEEDERPQGKREEAAAEEKKKKKRRDAAAEEEEQQQQPAPMKKGKKKAKSPQAAEAEAEQDDDGGASRERDEIKKKKGSRRQPQEDEESEAAGDDAVAAGRKLKKKSRQAGEASPLEERGEEAAQVKKKKKKADRQQAEAEEAAEAEAQPEVEEKRRGGKKGKKRREEEMKEEPEEAEAQVEQQQATEGKKKKNKSQARSRSGDGAVADEQRREQHEEEEEEQQPAEPEKLKKKKKDRAKVEQEAAPAGEEEEERAASPAERKVRRRKEKEKPDDADAASEEQQPQARRSEEDESARKAKKKKDRAREAEEAAEAVQRQAATAEASPAKKEKKKKQEDEADDAVGDDEKQQQPRRLRDTEPSREDKKSRKKKDRAAEAEVPEQEEGEADTKLRQHRKEQQQAEQQKGGEEDGKKKKNKRKEQREEEEAPQSQQPQEQSRKARGRAAQPAEDDDSGSAASTAAAAASRSPSGGKKEGREAGKKRRNKEREQLQEDGD